MNALDQCKELDRERDDIIRARFGDEVESAGCEYGRPVAVMPEYKSLEHGSTVIVANNAHELAYLISWCKEAGKGEPYLGDVEKFPFCVSVSGELAGWTDRMDRALYYKPFSEFLSDIEA